MASHLQGIRYDSGDLFETNPFPFSGVREGEQLFYAREGRFADVAQFGRVPAFQAGF